MEVEIITGSTTQELKVNLNEFLTENVEKTFVNFLYSGLTVIVIMLK